MAEKEPSRRHPLKGMQDGKLVARPKPVIIEGTPLAQSRFDRMMQDSSEQITLWKAEAEAHPIRKPHKTPLQNPRE